jgi:hypothetical protein
VLSQDPRKKRTKIIFPWVSVISFSPLWPLWHLCVSYRFESMPPCAYLSIFCHILFFATDPNDDRAHEQQHYQERFWVSRFKLWNGKTTFFFFLKTLCCLPSNLVCKLVLYDYSSVEFFLFYQQLDFLFQQLIHSLSSNLFFLLSCELFNWFFYRYSFPCTKRIQRSRAAMATGSHLL